MHPAWVTCPSVPLCVSVIEQFSYCIVIAFNLGAETKLSVWNSHLFIHCFNQAQSTGSVKLFGKKRACYVCKILGLFKNTYNGEMVKRRMRK